MTTQGEDFRLWSKIDVVGYTAPTLTVRPVHLPGSDTHWTENHVLQGRVKRTSSVWWTLWDDTEIQSCKIHKVYEYHIVTLTRHSRSNFLKQFSLYIDIQQTLYISLHCFFNTYFQYSWKVPWRLFFTNFYFNSRFP